MASYDEFDDDDQDNEPTPGDLRKALQKANRELAKLREAEASRASKTRDEALAAIIAQKKLSPKVAALVPKDLATDALANWFTENAEIFGTSAPSEGTSEQQDVKPDTSGLDAMNAAQAGAAPAGNGSGDDVIAAISNAKDDQEVWQILRGAGVAIT